MKQVLQNLRDGTTEVADVPNPVALRGRVLVRTSRSIISAGTERMLVNFGKANLIDKARQQPDKVRRVLDKVRTDGLVPTYEAIRDKLGEPLALGYSQVGTVVVVGEGVATVAVGDRVASNGKHAEIVAVSANLCAKVPEGVSDDSAAFTVLGAIALQGIRLVQPTLGECVVVTGLGLIGLLTVQLLRAHGCRVLGLDFDRGRLELAQQFGAETVNLSAQPDPITAAEKFSGGVGVDAVIITATAKSSEPVHQAALMCRKRGRIVLVGVTGLELSRADFYEKELTFQVSCSYGPGRYDPNYEERGNDYPIGFVRWTEQRNFQAVLDMMADGRLQVAPLISHRLPIGEAQKAYDMISAESGTLGILLDYPKRELKEEESAGRTIRLTPSAAAATDQPVISFIGAGGHASRVLLPLFKAAHVNLRQVASTGGVSSTTAARRFGFEEATTDVERIFADPQVDAVVVATRHDSHAELVVKALQANKHVFVEKPLCLTLTELEQIERVCRAKSEQGRLPLLMVGFNRRFAPQILKIRELIQNHGPKSFIMTVNAGALPASHWLLDKAMGGGRILGEVCHFVDLLRFLADASITRQETSALADGGDETVSLELGFADGSIGTIHYFANGHRSFAKERLEVFCAGRILQLDNFRTLRGFGWQNLRTMRLWRQDKGQKGCVEAFVEAISKGTAAPIPYEEIFEVQRVMLALSGRCPAAS